jgi:hypothetical protein
MKRLLVVAALLITACSPREDVEGGVVIWQSDNGEDRVVQLGPCVKTQTHGYSGWYTTHTECDVPSPLP